jgi:hypothetical protein
MKDIIEFPVVGTKFSEGGLLMASLLTEGAILILQPQPDNQFDADAIQVLAFEDIPIGYIPNKGLSCGVCWSRIDPLDQHCNKCNSSWDSFVEGGLATRLTKTGTIKKKHVCYVKAVDKEDLFSMVTAKLVIE